MQTEDERRAKRKRLQERDNEEEGQEKATTEGDKDFFCSDTSVNRRSQIDSRCPRKNPGAGCTTVTAAYRYVI